MQKKKKYLLDSVKVSAKGKTWPIAAFFLMTKYNSQNNEPNKGIYFEKQQSLINN